MFIFINELYMYVRRTTGGGMIEWNLFEQFQLLPLQRFFFSL